MRIEVSRLDLQEEFSDLPTSQIETKHFKPEVQSVIQSALLVAGGSAVFYEVDRSSYNRLLFNQ